MFGKIRKLPLGRQIFCGLSAVSVFLLLLTLCIALGLELRNQRARIVSVIGSTADYVAQLDAVGAMLERGCPDPEVKRQLDLLCGSYPELDVLAVYNRDGLRFYHTARRETGEMLLVGEEGPVLAGAAPYITTGCGTNGRPYTAFHAVEGAGGEIVGFVTVAMFRRGMSRAAQSLLPVYLMVLAVSLLLALLLSHVLVYLLRDALRGHNPTELLELYLRQGDVLDALEDGLVMTDRAGKILFSNRQAACFLNLPEEGTGEQMLCAYDPETRCVETGRGGPALHNRSCQVGQRQLLVSEIPIGAGQGALSVFHDKTELRKLSDELSGTRNMLDTLRLFNHEFLNKLHVILGYLQTGQTQEAIRLIMNSSLVSGQSIRATADCVRVPCLCALIIGKMTRAAELGVRLSVSPDSVCREEDLLLPAEAQCTVIGNLLQNAIDAFEADAEREPREIALSLYYRPDCNLIVCTDTAGGIAPEVQARIWERGVSSKGTGRGQGLYLVGQIIERYDGSVQTDSEAGEGTCFTVSFTNPHPSAGENGGTGDVWGDV